MRALIVDSGEGRGSLAAARALRHAGWTVGIACPSARGLAGRSRAVRHRHAVPALGDDPEGFLVGVQQALADGPYDVVLPCSDGEILALSRARERLDGRLPYAEHERLLGAIGKRRLAEAATKVGLRVPPCAGSVAEGRGLWGERPVVVKEDLHGTIGPDGRLCHVAPKDFADLGAAKAYVAEIAAAGGEPLVQPLIEGRLMAFTCVVGHSGELLARVQQIAERTYPRRAGLSVRAVTVPIDEQLSAQVGELQRTLGWFGLSQLQFLLPTEGPPVLLDFNGRIYGSLALALAAGVNLPDVWGRAAMGLALAARRDARAGVRYHWLEGDLRSLREEPKAQTLAGELVHTLAGALGCLAYGWRSHASIWSATDPWPGMHAAWDVAANKLSGAR